MFGVHLSLLVRLAVEAARCGSGGSAAAEAQAWEDQVVRRILFVLNWTKSSAWFANLPGLSLEHNITAHFGGVLRSAAVQTRSLSGVLEVGKLYDRKASDSDSDLPGDGQGDSESWGDVPTRLGVTVGRGIPARVVYTATGLEFRGTVAFGYLRDAAEGRTFALFTSPTWGVAARVLSAKGAFHAPLQKGVLDLSGVQLLYRLVRKGRNTPALRRRFIEVPPAVAAGLPNLRVEDKAALAAALGRKA